MQPMKGTETPRPNSCYVNINSIFNHQTPNKLIVKACTVLTDSTGQSVLGVFNEYVYTPECEGSIHLKIQMTAYGHDVDDVPMKLGGKQRIICHNHGGVQCIFPLQIENGLCYVPQQYPSVKEINTFGQDSRPSKEGATSLTLLQVLLLSDVQDNSIGIQTIRVRASS